MNIQELLKNSEAEVIEGVVHYANVSQLQQVADRLLLSHATLQPDKWIPCSERLPTEADADCNGSVWVKSKLYGVKLMQRHSVRADFESHWMPTGLTRPAPPEQESE